MLPWLQKFGPIDDLPIAKSVMSGSHHFHMEEQAEMLAAEIMEFWRAC
jgi:hypothetical protein